MNSSSSSLRTLVAAALLCLGFAAAAPSLAQALRPEVGKPLQAAQDMIKAGRYKEALAKVREADAAGPRGEEATLVER
ncbi:MAG: hypothetical protein ABI460_15505, partial [Caldimonas sp.]